MGCLENRIEMLCRKKGKLLNEIRYLQFGIQMETRTYDRIERELVFYSELEEKMRETGFNYHLYPRVKDTLLKLKRREEIISLRLETLNSLGLIAERKLDNITNELNIEIF
jgi:chaperonin cofactor prefoldin